jgi:hypothetical protein
MSTMVVRAGLATTAGSNFNLAAVRERSAPMSVDVRTSSPLGRLCVTAGQDQPI